MKWIVVAFMVLGGIQLGLSNIGSILPSYAHYLNSDYSQGGIRIASVVLVGLRLLFFVFAYGSGWSRLQSEQESRALPVFNQLLMLDIIISIAALPFNLLDRIEGYFALPFIVAIVNSFCKADGKTGWLCSMVAVLLSMAFISVVLIFRGSWYGLFPYRLVF